MPVRFDGVSSCDSRSERIIPKTRRTHVAACQVPLRAMPELPEVETVRRGLSPVMEGARFTKVEMNRPDLRRPLPKDFVKRLEGKTVTGLGRRAKYLLADLSSGEVLLMRSEERRVGKECRSRW